MYGWWILIDKIMIWITLSGDVDVTVIDAVVLADYVGISVGKHWFF